MLNTKISSSDKSSSTCGDKSSSSSDILIQVSELIAGNLDPEATLKSSLYAVTNALDTEAASIILYDELQNDLFFYIVNEGSHADKIKNCRVPIDENTICGWTALHKQALLIPNTSLDDRFNQSYDKKTGFKTRSMMSLPLIAKGRFFGVLQVLNPLSKQFFSDADLPLTEAVSHLVALAIYNAKEHEARIQAERQASIGQAIFGMAHCIKNILNGIHAGSFIIDQKTKDEKFVEIKQGWSMVKRNLRLLNDITLNMLAYSKDRKPMISSVVLRDLCEDVYALMGEQARVLGVELVLQCESLSSSDRVMLDDAAIRRCLINLIANAMDACAGRADARVILQAKKESPDDANAFSISVSDNGCGISNEVLSQLFTPFFSTKGNQGTGLGLPVTKKLVEEQGGSITVNSTLGVGTAFILNFQHRSEECCSLDN